VSWDEAVELLWRRLRDRLMVPVAVGLGKFLFGLVVFALSNLPVLLVWKWVEHPPVAAAVSVLWAFLAYLAAAGLTGMLFTPTLARPPYHGPRVYAEPTREGERSKVEKRKGSYRDQ
jgi:hypothetical protein